MHEFKQIKYLRLCYVELESQQTRPIILFNKTCSKRWDSSGMFFMFGVILIFIGVLGEYIGSIHNYVKKRPIVVEKERINF